MKFYLFIIDYMVIKFVIFYFDMDIWEVIDILLKKKILGVLVLDVNG